MEIDPDLLKSLMEIGFLAGRTGRLKEAGIIFEGLAQVRPKSPYPRIGLGYVAMAHGKFSKAADILRSAPTNDRNELDLCQGFLGMALKLGGHHDECRVVLTKLQSEGENQAAVRMAGNLLENF